MPQIRIKAPAKLNLHLQIGDRRPDGFHDIESLFLALAFGDTLGVETVPQPLSFEICMDGQLGSDSGLSPEKNIVSRAVSLFRDRTGYEKGLKISLEKRIPLGGGLGGGSSDAAAALLALNQVADPAGKGLLSGAELAEMGACLGSDVPFFLFNCSAAWVSGRGEKIQPLVLPKSAYSLSFVLVNPGFPSDTAEAYRLFDAQGKNSRIPHRGTGHTENTEEENRLTLCDLRELRASVRDLFEYSGYLAKPPREWPFFNDFLPVFIAAGNEIPAYSEAGTIYQQIITDLKEQGAEFAGLSGSGSTCFGVFSDRAVAEQAAQFLLKRWFFVIHTFLLAH
jgi:4-diphosphocytidyl-2-C-methyl-D-erythritol kinase